MKEAKSIQEIEQEEKVFLENFPSQSNLRTDFDSLLEYGFFHCTPSNNVESISQTGLEPRIGKNSQGYENEKRVYYSVGAIGALGIVNRAIFLKMSELSQGKGVPFEDVKDEAFKEIFDFYNDGVFFKLDIDDGVEFDSNDFMTRRNSHTINDITVPASKMKTVSIDGKISALDVISFMYSNVDARNVRRGKLKVGEEKITEEYYLDDFFEFVKDLPREDKKVDGLDKFDAIDLAERKLALDIKAKKPGLADVMTGNIRTSAVKGAEEVVLDSSKGIEETEQDKAVLDLGEN